MKTQSYKSKLKTQFKENSMLFRFYYWLRKDKKEKIKNEK